jgi:hypothetical protein
MNLISFLAERIIKSEIQGRSKRLTPELTGAGDNAETIQVLDERPADSASGSMSC